MALMDAETGKLLHYKHLLKHPKYKGKMANLISKWIWQIGPMCWRQNQRYEHNHIYLHGRCSKRTHERCYIWSICLYGLARKSGSKLNTFCCRWGRNQLPWWGSDSHSLNACCKTSIQQHYFTSRREIHDNGHLHFYQMTPLKRP